MIRLYHLQPSIIFSRDSDFLGGGLIVYEWSLNCSHVYSRRRFDRFLYLDGTVFPRPYFGVNIIRLGSTYVLDLTVVSVREESYHRHAYPTWADASIAKNSLTSALQKEGIDYYVCEQRNG